MNDIERKFLLAVERGDLQTLKNLLNSPERRLNINCCDPLARNALVIAIDKENLEMVKLLLEANIKMGDALLYAIDENFVEAVELLLDHECDSTGSSSPSNASILAGASMRAQYSWEQDRDNSFFSADMTPLILAAHRNNFEIIKILLDRRVSPIPDPHDPRCNCVSCSKARSEDCLRHSQSRINAYRALASPCLMALSSPDPLLTAFQMSARLESLATMEPEYKEDYLRLRTQCQIFATKLLDHTRTSKELEILLNYSDDFLDGHDHGDDQIGQLCCRGSLYDMSTSRLETGLDTTSHVRLKKTTTLPSPSLGSCARPSYPRFPNCEAPTSSAGRTGTQHSLLSLDSVTGRHESYQSHMRLARLRLAIHCKQKTFCAHPNIQELLATMWYENLPGFREKNPLAQALQILFIGIMFPVYSIAYLVAPQSQLGRYIKKPFIKFICHSSSYITFLIVLILASQRVEAFYSWDSVLSLLFANKDKINLEDDAQNLTIFKQMSSQNAPSMNNVIDDTDIQKLAAFYKQYGSSNPMGSASTARGLESLSKIFEELPASSKKRGTPPSPIELVILLWVVSLIWAELKQIRALGLNYYKADMWNILDSVASGFYIATIILRVVSYLRSDASSNEVAREHWHAYDSTLLSEGLFAAATIFSALKLVYIFSVNPYLGPLQLSLGRMIVDIVRFSWIYMLVLFSFACGMNQLLWYYADLERHHCLNITNYSLAQYYSAQHERARLHATGEDHMLHEASEASSVTTSITSINNTIPKFINDVRNSSIGYEETVSDFAIDEEDISPPVPIDDSCKTWRYFSNVFESSQTLFWATFGLVDLDNFDLTGIKQYTRFWALLMFGCYCFINVIVVLNLLIAMMNHSYVKISKRSDIEWKFARTRLWMSYFDTGSTVPAPFNILPSIKSMKYLALSVYALVKQILRWTGAAICSMACKNEHKTSSLNITQLGPSDNISLAETQINSIAGDDFVMQSCTARREMPATDQRPNSIARRELGRRYCSLTASYQNVMRSLVRRYLIKEQRLVEKKRELTEAKLNRWAKMNAFD